MKYFPIFVLFACPAFAVEQYNFRVEFPGGLAAEEIAAGDHAAAIKVLEARNGHPEDGELTTLCGLYIIEQRLVIAHGICDAAVATDQSYEAYNNRGVLRVHLKNLQGALIDFNKSKRIYINAVITADENHTEAVRYVDDHKYDPSIALSNRASRVEVEELQ